MNEIIVMGELEDGLKVFLQNNNGSGFNIVVGTPDDGQIVAEGKWLPYGDPELIDEVAGALKKGSAKTAFEKLSKSFLTNIDD